MRNKPAKKSDLELAKDRIAVDSKNRSDAAVADYNKAVAEIKKKYDVVMVISGQFSGSQIRHIISFQPVPISIQKT